MTSKHIWIMMVIVILITLISRWILDDYGLQYRFYRKVLRKRLIYELVFWGAFVSNLSFLILGILFPSWWIFILGGLWIGTVGELVPFFYSKYNRASSYREMCEIYIAHADLWEKNIKKAKEKRAKRREKRKRKP